MPNRRSLVGGIGLCEYGDIYEFGVLEGGGKCYVVMKLMRVCWMFLVLVEGVWYVFGGFAEVGR